MYKIYINEKVLGLCSTEELPRHKPFSDGSLIARYDGRRKFLFHYIDTLEKPTPYKKVILYHDDVDKLKKDVKSIFDIMHAAGGIVLNENHDMLLIHRRGRWDLPKGKCDPGEKKKQTAKREVKEETGARGITVYHKLIRTRHAYREQKDGTRVLKIVHWYLLTANNGPLRPETKEGIDQAVWVAPSEVSNHIRHSYQTVKEVFEAFKSDDTIDDDVRALF